MTANVEAAPGAVSAQQGVARAAARHDVQAALAWFRARERELTESQLELSRIAAPPFGEAPRAQWLKRCFEELGLSDVHIDEIGNVFGVLRGTRPDGKFVAISAHIDTVFPAGTELNVRREGERLFGAGVSDNGAGVTAMLALAGALSSAPVPRASSLVFIGNVGEEGEGDLRGMRHIFTNPKWRDVISYTLVLDGAGSDTIISEGLGSKRLEVTVRGPGGHSWSDFGVPNPIVALARAVEQFARVPVSNNPKTTFNIGVIRGGTSVNSIPESASMRVDIRSASSEEIERLERMLREAVHESVVAETGAARARNFHGQGLREAIDYIGSRPAAELDANARILQVVRAVDAHLGVNSRVQRASTDANVPISLGREAVAIGAGGTGGGAHTLHEWYDPAGRDLGLKRALLITLTLAGVGE